MSADEPNRGLSNSCLDRECQYSGKFSDTDLEYDGHQLIAIELWA